MALGVPRRCPWLVLLLVACDRAPSPSPPVAAPAAKQAPAGELEAKTARARIQDRLNHPPTRPERFKQQRCPDAEIGRHPPAERELSLRVLDARYDLRRVLPQRVTRHLTAPDLNELDQVLAGVDAPGAAEQKRAALGSVERLVRQRFVGVYHVTHYAAPKWVVRVGRVKPVWDAGRLDTWFAIHDAESGEALCASRVSVVGDATDAPVRVRLRSDTRDRLTDELGERLRAATPGALGRISSALVLPGSAEPPLARR
jgi:hypothetical protein